MEDRGGEKTLKVAMQEAQIADESLAKLAEVYGQSEPALSEMTTDEAKDEMMPKMRARRFQTFQSSIDATSSTPPDSDEVEELFGLTVEYWPQRALSANILPETRPGGSQHARSKAVVAEPADKDEGAKEGDKVAEPKDLDSEDVKEDSDGVELDEEIQALEVEVGDGKKGTYVREAWYSEASREAMKKATGEKVEIMKGAGHTVRPMDSDCFGQFLASLDREESRALPANDCLPSFSDIAPFVPSSLLGVLRKRLLLGPTFNGNAHDLEQCIRALPLNDPGTAKVIVVTSYTTAAARFLRHWMVDKKSNKRYPFTRLTRTECEEEGMDREAYITASAIAAELNEERGGKKSYELRVNPGLFGTSIWDEAHRLKNVKTMQLFTGLNLQHRRVILLTASPFMARLKDLTSILRIASETSTATVKATKTEDGTLPIEHYDHIRQVLADCGGSYLKADDRTRTQLVTALDHEAYTKLMDDHDKDSAVVRRVVPAPLGIIRLRVTGQIFIAHGQQPTIAGSIPSFHCTVVELHPNPVEMEMYEVAHKAKFGERTIAPSRRSIRRVCPRG
ncbi:hypothetical protein LTR12_001493 [Friedmanniomyces endolithicus]|nr:hypothetical protein LTR74_016615 [Friedmanniomyces endolithicus]KAK1823960.1 hypothetical protein LTR12_001493 [Friedmanniomyces endolithicus]